ncbi:hypothetical protein CVU37_14320 [candidate division BRC1 bacterium HGW-BRC1-1]|jgi:hypothetical protein|nr:MAG: hypothetical protein CVU37_14320 [candidate division BRC1 bacterium HGW-BRC1-1]
MNGSYFRPVLWSISISLLLLLAACQRDKQRMVAALPPTPTPVVTPEPTPTPRPAIRIVTPLDLNKNTSPTIVMSVTTMTLMAMRHQLDLVDEHETTAVKAGQRLLLLDQIGTLVNYGLLLPTMEGSRREQFVELGYEFQRNLFRAAEEPSLVEIKQALKQMRWVIGEMDRMTSSSMAAY